MSKRFILGLGVLLAGLPAATLALAGAGSDRVLREREHESIGDLVSKWISAHSDPRVDRAKAQGDVRDEFEKLERRRTGDRPMLALTADLGRALWFSQGYSKQRVRPGVETVESVVRLRDHQYPLEYAVSVPSSYRPRSNESHPLLLILPDVPMPGQAAGPRQFLTEQWQEPEVRDKAILVAVGMPQEKDDEGNIDVSAWSADGGQGSQGGVANLLTVYSEVTRKYAVDFDRIYLVGHGAGVAAAMSIASKFPDRFAGVIGRRGDAVELAPGNFRNLPTYFAGGGAKATAFAEASSAAGQENVTIAPDASEADIWAWIQEHPRAANPDEVVLVPGDPFPNKAYWLEVPALDGATDARVRARIDRETNTITIESQGVSEVMLFFNDELVDLDRTVKVVCNGKEQPEELIPRNLNTFLDLVWTGRNDPGKLYVARKRYDVAEQ